MAVELPWTTDQLRTTEIHTDYLVRGVIVKDQPCVIAGVQKSWKTTIAIELAVCMAAGVPFLKNDDFSVPVRQNVLVLSAESGKATVRETFLRIEQSKAIRVDDNAIRWGWWVPRLADSVNLQALELMIRSWQIGVVIIDPLYLAMSGDIQTNLSLAGEQLGNLAKRCVELGCTPICIDHVKRSSNNAREYKPLELADITGAGKAEFFRQWVLVGRRGKYDPDNPVAELVLTCGGSAGHGGQFAVDIDESRDDAGARTWSVDVERYARHVQAEKEAKAEAKRARDAQRAESDDATVAHYLEVRGASGSTKNAIKGNTKLSLARIAESLARLMDRGLVMEATVLTPHSTRKEGAKRAGFVWADAVPDDPKSDPKSDPSPDLFTPSK